MINKLTDIDGCIGSWRADVGVTSFCGAVTNWADQSGFSNDLAPKLNNSHIIEPSGSVHFNGHQSIEFISSNYGDLLRKTNCNGYEDITGFSFVVIHKAATNSSVVFSRHGLKACKRLLSFPAYEGGMARLSIIMSGSVASVHSIEIAEAAVYSRKLTTAEKTRIKEYAETRYGIPKV